MAKFKSSKGRIWDKFGLLLLFILKLKDALQVGINREFNSLLDSLLKRPPILSFFNFFKKFGKRLDQL
jgi:hypothetical protein